MQIKTTENPQKSYTSYLFGLYLKYNATNKNKFFVPFWPFQPRRLSMAYV